MKMLTTISSHDRILLAGKTLFARNGYEKTSTVAIARQAGTSESQLMKHFGSKLGLLASILEQGWTDILQKLPVISTATASSPQPLLEILDALVAELDRDPELKTLLMLESRRICPESANDLPCVGFRQFCALLENVLGELKSRGTLRPGLDVIATRAALYGVVESMTFEQLACERRGGDCYGPEQAREVLHSMVLALAPEPVFLSHQAD